MSIWPWVTYLQMESNPEPRVLAVMISSPASARQDSALRQLQGDTGPTAKVKVKVRRSGQGQKVRSRSEDQGQEVKIEDHAFHPRLTLQ